MDKHIVLKSYNFYRLTDAENRIKSMHQEHAAMTKQLLEVKSELSATKTRLAEAQDKMRSAPSPQGNKARGNAHTHTHTAHTLTFTLIHSCI